MTGIERNSDIVVMASYAPLFANLGNKNWNPDLIYFDSSRVVSTPSYHVQRLFSENRGDVVLPTEVSVTAPETARHGAIGLGTWNTQASYSNVVVTKAGQTLYQSSFASGATGWRVYNGTWTATGGTYRQTALTTDCRSTTGDTDWSDYTITLKARKDGGSEGFLILYNWLDDQNWTWWNIGGWNNTQHAIEHCQGGGKSIVGSYVPGQVETGRWYDIRIELSGERIRCYLDGQLIQDAVYPAEKPLHATASRVQDSNEIILKVVNVAAESTDTEIRLVGAGPLHATGTATVLTGAPSDENSLDGPNKVTPVSSPVNGVGPQFRYTFAPHSLTVLRLGPAK